MQTPNLKSNDLKSGMKVSDKAVRKDKKKKKKERMKRMSDLVRKGLIDLPDPENEYQFEFGDKTEDENDIAQIKEGGETDGGLVETIEDAEEELRRREQKERERVPALSKRLLSEIAKRDLPAGQVNRRFGLGGGAQLDTGSVEFVVERDNAVKRILREFNQGSMNAYEALNELESLVATDGSDNAKLIKEAQEMVDQEMRKFSDEEWKGIEEVLEREFSPRKTGETRLKNLPRAVDQDYEKVEEIFQNEGKKRRHSFEVTKGNEKDELLLQSKDFDLEDLQKQVDEYYGGVRICEKAARATDELSIMNLINSLKD